MCLEKIVLDVLSTAFDCNACDREEDEKCTEQCTLGWKRGTRSFYWPICIDENNAWKVGESTLCLTRRACFWNKALKI